jgi:peptidoglycan hydrolase-like protein with peptidoglycan-binding domain
MANNQKYKTTPKTQSNKKTYVVLGIALGTLSLAGFGYWYFKGRKGAVIENKDTDLFHNMASNTPPTLTTPTTKPSTASNQFPLKLNSKGDLVKQLQNELIKKYGSSILPKFGADGFFGKELETALVSKGFSKTVDSTEFNQIVALNSSTSETATAPTKSGLSDTVKENINITKNIWLYSSTKNLAKLLEQLKRITTIEEYKAVNDLFKTIRLHGVRQTIVNGTLNSFSDDTSKQLIRLEFTRIGLKYDGDKWTLSGFFKRQIFTRQPTVIRNRYNAQLEVPTNTILGEEQDSINGITTFRTINNEVLTVPTKHIHYV